MFKKNKIIIIIIIKIPMKFSFLLLKFYLDHAPFGAQATILSFSLVPGSSTSHTIIVSSAHLEGWTQFPPYLCWCFV